MARASQLIILVLALTSVSIFPITHARHVSANADGNDKLATICKHTSHPDICFEAAKLYPGLIPVVNIDNVFRAQIAMAKDRTIAARDEAAKLLPGRKGNELNLVLVCSNIYGVALDDLAAAVEYEDKDIERAVSILSSVEEGYGDCDTGFNQSHVANPLAKTNELLRHMVGNSIEIVFQKD